MSRKLRWILLALVVVVLCVSLSYYKSVVYLEIKTTHVDTIEIYRTEFTPKPIISISPELGKLKLSKGSYYIRYVGAEGYADTFKLIQLSERNQQVSYDAPFSSSHLAQILSSESSAIRAAITAAFPNVKSYQIQSGVLYRNGEWYGTTLRYSGPDIFNADTIRLMAHKNNGVWTVSTTKPDITLSKLLYPSIPDDIIKSVNNL